MRRMAIGTVAGVAIWIGSAVAAEAQGITPTGPTKVLGGSTCSTFTAGINLPDPCAYVARLWVYRAGIEIHYSQTLCANPGVVNSTFTKVAVFSTTVNSGDVLTYHAMIKVGSTWYTGQDWVVTVTATRPPSQTYQKSTSLALQSVERDRRRE